MRYGIFSDIHSNYEALSEVIKIYEKEKIDKFICAGDIIGYGAEPDRCIEKIKEINAVCVMGNHEYAIKNPASAEFFNDAAYLAIKWQSENINYLSRDFILKLPFKINENIFTVVHGSAFEPENFHYVLSTEDYLKNFRYFDTKILIIGHTHLPDVFYFDEKRKIYGQITGDKFSIENDIRYIINTGSVGQPRDNDKRACFCIYDDESSIFYIKRVEYDVKSAMKKILDAGLPEVLAYRLQQGV